MFAAYRRAMDVTYWACAVIAGVSLVLISAVIPWGVYTRYIVNRAATWPEPMAVLLTIVLTFIGAPACYRLGLHMRVGIVVDLLPRRGQRAMWYLAELLMGGLGAFMLIWGAQLVATTWPQTIDAFPFLPVGATYLPVPVGGAITLLFVVERLFLGPPTPHGEAAAAPVAFE
jgi:TRAP-type C4-dicarboxylate transport system permease small subunit